MPPKRKASKKSTKSVASKKACLAGPARPNKRAGAATNGSPPAKKRKTGLDDHSILLPQSSQGRVLRNRVVADPQMQADDFQVPKRGSQDEDRGLSNTSVLIDTETATIQAIADVGEDDVDESSSPLSDVSATSFKTYEAKRTSSYKRITVIQPKKTVHFGSHDSFRSAPSYGSSSYSVSGNKVVKDGEHQEWEGFNDAVVGQNESKDAENERPELIEVDKNGLSEVEEDLLEEELVEVEIEESSVVQQTQASQEPVTESDREVNNDDSTKNVREESDSDSEDDSEEDQDLEQRMLNNASQDDSPSLFGAENRDSTPATMNSEAKNEDSTLQQAEDEAGAQDNASESSSAGPLKEQYLAQMDEAEDGSEEVAVLATAEESADDSEDSDSQDEITKDGLPTPYELQGRLAAYAYGLGPFKADFKPPPNNKKRIRWASTSLEKACDRSEWHFLPAIRRAAEAMIELHRVVEEAGPTSEALTPYYKRIILALTSIPPLMLRRHGSTFRGHEHEDLRRLIERTEHQMAFLGCDKKVLGWQELFDLERIAKNAPDMEGLAGSRP